MVRRDLINFIGDSSIGIFAFIKAFGLFFITNDPDLFERWLYVGTKSLEQYVISQRMLTDASEDMTRR